MRVKSDYMGNDQLLPAYNMQAVICDEYIAAISSSATDMYAAISTVGLRNSMNAKVAKDAR